MALPNVWELSSEQLLHAQTHVWNHIFAFVNSMSLKCAVQLNIPDIIHTHGEPMALSDLVAALFPTDDDSSHKSKSNYIRRLMRVLTHAGFFTKTEEEKAERYWLTPASRLLLADAPLTLAPLAMVVFDPILMESWQHMSRWLQDKGGSSTTHTTEAEEHRSSPFEAAHGKPFWEIVARETRLNEMFNEAMSRDARLVAGVLVRDCGRVFEGVESLVDVGGGIGTVAKAVAGAFPGVRCTVLDQPHVVAGLGGTIEKVSFIGGDMFESIPPADAVLLKWILHDWDDKDCVKILKNCKDALIRRSGVGGKVIIIDMIVDIYDEGAGDKAIEDQLFFDMAMMTYLNGKERSEEEWAKLFSDAGLRGYKITPAFGVRSLIEVFP